MLTNDKSNELNIPTQSRHVDINIKFSGCSKFEYTAEIALFDIFHIRLFHSWVVDPQDKVVSTYRICECVV